jgi:hypothetical protein
MKWPFCILCTEEDLIWSVEARYSCEDPLCCETMNRSLKRLWRSGSAVCKSRVITDQNVIAQQFLMQNQIAYVMETYSQVYFWGWSMWMVMAYTVWSHYVNKGFLNSWFERCSCIAVAQAETCRRTLAVGTADTEHISPSICGNFFCYGVWRVVWTHSCRRSARVSER